MINSSDESVKVPSRARLTGHILSLLNKEATELVRNTFSSTLVVELSSDLWMSYGAQIIFSIVAYVCIFLEGLNPYHLDLVRMRHTFSTSFKPNWRLF